MKESVYYMKIICSIHKMHGGHNLMLNLIHLYLNARGDSCLKAISQARAADDIAFEAYVVDTFSRISICAAIAAQAIAGQFLFHCSTPEMVLFCFVFQQFQQM